MSSQPKSMSSHIAEMKAVFAVRIAIIIINAAKSKIKSLNTRNEVQHLVN